MKLSVDWLATVRGRFSLTGEGETISPRRRFLARSTAVEPLAWGLGLGGVREVRGSSK